METTFQSDGKAIRMDYFEPKGEGAVAAILLLHGAGGNSGFWLERLVPLIAGAGVAVYAAHYFDRTGTVRADVQTLTDGVHVPQWLDAVGDALRWVKSRPGVAADRVGLVGISLGAFLSLALATRVGAGEVRAIVELSGGLVEPYVHAATKRFPPTLILHGDADTVVAVSHARALDAVLTKLGVEHAMHVFAGEGHWFSGGAQMRILGLVAEFLGRHLRGAAGSAG